MQLVHVKLERVLTVRLLVVLSELLADLEPLWVIVPDSAHVRDVNQVRLDFSLARVDDNLEACLLRDPLVVPENTLEFEDVDTRVMVELGLEDELATIRFIVDYEVGAQVIGSSDRVVNLSTKPSAILRVRDGGIDSVEPWPAGGLLLRHHDVVRL